MLSENQLGNGLPEERRFLFVLCRVDTEIKGRLSRIIFAGDGAEEGSAV